MNESKQRIPKYIGLTDPETAKEFRDLVRALYGREYGYMGKEATAAIQAWIPDLRRRVKEAQSQQVVTPSFA